MEKSTRMDMMKLLVTVAWADDELTKREREELKRCAREVGLDEVEQELIFEDLDVPADPLALTTLQRTMRDNSGEVIALARMVALADGKLDASEARVLRVLVAAAAAARGQRKPEREAPTDKAPPARWRWQGAARGLVGRARDRL